MSTVLLLTCWATCIGFGFRLGWEALPVVQQSLGYILVRAIVYPLAVFQVTTSNMKRRARYSWRSWRNMGL